MKLSVVCSPCFRDESMLDSVSTIVRSCFQELGLDLHLSVSHVDVALSDSRQRSFVLVIRAIEDHESEVLIEKWTDLIVTLSDFLNTNAGRIMLVSKYAVA